MTRDGTHVWSIWKGENNDRIHADIVSRQPVRDGIDHTIDRFHVPASGHAECVVRHGLHEADRGLVQTDG